MQTIEICAEFKAEDNREIANDFTIRVEWIVPDNDGDVFPTSLRGAVSKFLEKYYNDHCTKFEEFHRAHKGVSFNIDIRVDVIAVDVRRALFEHLGETYPTIRSASIHTVDRMMKSTIVYRKFYQATEK